MQEGQLSHEEAKIAKQNFIKMTQQSTQLLKEEVRATKMYLSSLKSLSGTVRENDGFIF